MLTLPELPYSYNALEPLMSVETLKLHHDEHHKTYVNKANALAAGGGLEHLGLEDLIRCAQDNGQASLYNNAAQAWNHAFLWESMAPGGGVPTGGLSNAIGADFGDMSDLRKEFVQQGKAHFGSGWVWLLRQGERLKVVTTHDAGTLLPASGLVPLLVCDVWEHAYYLDHRNDREAYLEAWFDKLANWGFASRQFEAEIDSVQAYHYPLAA